MIELSLILCVICCLFYWLYLDYFGVVVVFTIGVDWLRLCVVRFALVGGFVCLYILFDLIVLMYVLILGFDLFVFFGWGGLLLGLWLVVYLIYLSLLCWMFVRFCLFVLRDVCALFMIEVYLFEVLFMFLIWVYLVGCLQFVFWFKLWWFVCWFCFAGDAFCLWVKCCFILVCVCGWNIVFTGWGGLLNAVYCFGELCW